MCVPRRPRLSFPLCVGDSFCSVSAGPGSCCPAPSCQPNLPAGAPAAFPPGGLRSRAQLDPRSSFNICSSPRSVGGLLLVCFSSPFTMQSSGPVPSAVSKVLRVKVTGVLALNRTLACIWFIFSSPEMNRECTSPRNATYSHPSRGDTRVRTAA